MSKPLTQPPCSYCGSPTEPVRQKKLESTKYFFCCNPCERKHYLMTSYQESLINVNDPKTASYLNLKLKSAVDMLYTAESMKKQDCVFIFTNSVDSFKLDGAVKQEYINTLQLRGKELIKEIDAQANSGKIRITKEQ